MHRMREIYLALHRVKHVEFAAAVLKVTVVVVVVMVTMTPYLHPYSYSTVCSAVGVGGDLFQGLKYFQEENPQE